MKHLAELMDSLNILWKNEYIYTIYFLEKQLNLWDMMFYGHMNN